MDDASSPYNRTSAASDQLAEVIATLREVPHQQPAASNESVARRAFRLGWRSCLSGLPSIFGRLAQIASVRQHASGQAADPEFAMLLGEETEQELREAQYQIFMEWLSLSLEEQKADFDCYLSSLEGYRRQIIQELAQSAPYRQFIPELANTAERELYLANLGAIVALLQNQYGLWTAPEPRRAVKVPFAVR